MNKNSYCDPTLEDFPVNFDEAEIRFQLSSDCCGAGVYRTANEVTCYNCTEPCKVIEDLILS